MFNLEQGTPLAIRQDRVFGLIMAGKSVPNSDYVSMRDNFWVKTACSLAPSNLTVRHYILLDLIERRTIRLPSISKMIGILAPDLWAEGYSYWRYTKPFIEKYRDQFAVPILMEVCEAIDNNFLESAYIGRYDDVRPAPFGDLRDEAIVTDKRPPDGDITLRFLKRIRNVYYISPYPLGFNGHVPTKASQVEIVNGIPLGFVYYTGYENKIATQPVQPATVVTKTISAIKGLFRL